MPIYIGMDGGGTKTKCALGDEVSVLAVTAGPGSNVVRLGEEQARVGLETSIGEACKKAGVSPSDVASVCIGAAGAGHEKTAETVRRILREVVPNARSTVVGDMVIAHEAALSGAPGVVVIAGTGSIAYGRNPSGETARAGGWGYAISDEGSGQWIGRTAVAEVMHAFDRARSTVLFDRILKAWSLETREQLVRHANSSPPPNFSELFPVVQLAATEHDKLAEEILSRAGQELSQLVLAVLRRLWTPNERVRIGVAGGIFAHSAAVRRAFYASLCEEWPTVSVCFQVVDPVVGALNMARRTAALSGA